MIKFDYIKRFSILLLLASRMSLYYDLIQRKFQKRKVLLILKLKSTRKLFSFNLVLFETVDCSFIFFDYRTQPEPA